MKRQRGYKLLAILGFGLGLYSLVRYEMLLIEFEKAKDELKQVVYDMHFDEITKLYHTNEKEK